MLGIIGYFKGVKCEVIDFELFFVLINMIGWLYGYMDIVLGECDFVIVMMVVIGLVYYVVFNVYLGYFICFGINFVVLFRFEVEQFLVIIE